MLLIMVDISCQFTEFHDVV